MEKFIVWESGEDEDAREIETETPEDAVEIWAGEYDMEDGEYPIAGKGRSLIVFVDIGHATLEFIVHGEFTPNYYVNEVS